MSDQNGARLSPKQSNILAYIEQEIALLGRPPSLRDIARHFGYDAIGTVQDHVRALIKKGFLEKEPGRARGLRPAHHAESLGVPILGTVPAGRPIEAIEDRQGALPIPNRWSGDLFALRVTGDSMIEAGIMDGDYVVVKKQGHARNGAIVVAMIEGEATVKYLDTKDGRVRLIPANPKYSPIVVPPHAENVIQGIVVSVQRYYG